MSVCRLSPRDERWMRATYRELHEGLDADSFECSTPVNVPVGTLTLLGYLSEIQYLKEVPEGRPSYWHPFEEHAQPKLYRDSVGRMFVRGRRYVTTTAGIEDLPVGKSTKKSHLSRPKLLVTLGTLEWLKYRSEGGSHTLRFESSARPIVTHDELGKLHFVHGNHRVEANPMAKHRRRYSRKHHAVRANPKGGDFMSKSKTVATMAAIVSGSFAVSQIVLNKLSSMAPTTNIYIKAAAKAVAGVAGAVAASQVKAVPPSVLSGFAIAGVYGAGQDLYAAYRASHPAAGLLGSGYAPAFAGARNRVSVAR